VAININNIQYSNSRVKDAIVATSGEHFGRHHMRDNTQRLPAQTKELKPMQGVLPVKPQAVNLVADAPRAVRPPEQITSRPVVVNKRPQQARLPWQPEARSPVTTEPRYVQPPKSGVTELRRPEPGKQLGPERARPPLPSRYEDWQQQTSPAPSATVSEPRVGSGNKPDAGRVAEPRSNRFEPREINESSRWREPAVQPQVVIPAPRQQQGEPAMQQRNVEPVMRQPSRGGRDSGEPAPAPVRIAPQERMQQVPAEVNPRSQRFEQMPQMDQPRGGRVELPGVPANRVYRDANPRRSDVGRQEQGRPTQVMPAQGTSNQGGHSQSRPDQGKPQR
jgi:hypothetical protein